MEELEKKIQKILDDLRDLEPEVAEVNCKCLTLLGNYYIESIDRVVELLSEVSYIKENRSVKLLDRELEAPESILSDSNPEPILRPMLEPKKALEAKIEAERQLFIDASNKIIEEGMKKMFPEECEEEDK